MNLCFKKDKELQEKIISERAAGLTTREIAELNPQYSEVTYKRFLSKCGIEPTSRSTEKYKNKQRDSQRKSWDARDEEAKKKHIEHLRELAASQKGVPLVHSDSWKAKNLIHITGESVRAGVTKFNKDRKKYTTDVILKKAEILGVSIEGDLSDSENTIIVRPPLGAPRTMQIKKMMLMSAIPPKYTSIGQAELSSFIDELGIKWHTRKTNGYEIDIYMPDISKGIEYNGLYWHSEANDKGSDYHLGKTTRAKNEGIDLIHVFEHEWFERKEQVKSRIRSILVGSDNIIHARKTEVSEVSPDAALEFINKFHIQPLKKRPAYSLGLFFEGTLVSVAAFNRHHRKDGWVLQRFVTLPNTSVVGGLSRLSRHASKHFNEDIISWCDLRWSEGNGYLKAGWEKDAVLPPDYFYIDTNKQCKVVSKQSRQKKKVNTPEGMTEYEHSLLDGLSRVWDCGKIRFIFRKR